MKPLSVWFHAKINGEGIPNPDAATAIMGEQMNALIASGLANKAQDLHIGINGSDSDALLAAQFSPPNAQFHVHGPQARSEIPTLALLRQSLRPGWLVLYHHTKGVTHPDNELWDAWRRCMERGCVWNWVQCVDLLSTGTEAAGCHWLTPERYPGAVKTPFFGGTFWWSTSDYLLSLPPLPEATYANRYEAESWIGRGPRRPRLVDFHATWPGMCCK